MKKIMLVLLAMVCLLAPFAMGASAGSGVYGVSGAGLTLEIPNDYVVVDQKKVIGGRASDAGLDQEFIDDMTEIMRESGCLLYAEQLDGFDAIYLDTDFFTETRGMRDFTAFCATGDRSDEELLDALAAASVYRKVSEDAFDYASEKTELVTVNGEKYGYALGYFGGEDYPDYVAEYDTVKNGKWLRIEMYCGGQPPSAAQEQVLRGIVQSIGYERGAAGFASQAVWGMNGAKLLPLIVLGVAVIAAVVVLVIVLCRRKKKKRLQMQAQPPLSPHGGTAAGQMQVPPAYQSPVQQPPQQAPYAGQQPVQPGQYAPGQPVQPGQYAPVQPIQPGQYAPVQPIQPGAPSQAYQPPAMPRQEIRPETPPAAPVQPEAAAHIPVIEPQFKESAQPAQGQPVPQAGSVPPAPQQEAPAPQQEAPAAPQDVFQMLEELSELKRRGVISDEEFMLKKKELLKRL